MLDTLPPRERQIIDALYARGEATAAEVRDALSDPPSYSAIRSMLARLERKGFVRHRVVEQRYLYSPAVSDDAVATPLLKQLVNTFFNGSAVSAATALLGMAKRADPKELDELAALIDRVRREDAP